MLATDNTAANPLLGRHDPERALHCNSRLTALRPSARTPRNYSGNREKKTARATAANTGSLPQAHEPRVPTLAHEPQPTPATRRSRSRRTAARGRRRLPAQAPPLSLPGDGDPAGASGTLRHRPTAPALLRRPETARPGPRPLGRAERGRRAPPSARGQASGPQLAQGLAGRNGTGARGANAAPRQPAPQRPAAGRRRARSPPPPPGLGRTHRAELRPHRCPLPDAKPPPATPRDVARRPANQRRAATFPPPPVAASCFPHTAPPFPARARGPAHPAGAHRGR